MSVGSGGMAGGRGGPSLCDIRGVILELPIWGLLQGRRQIGGGLSPRCGQSGSSRTRSSSGVPPHQAIPLYTPPRGLIFFEEK